MRLFAALGPGDIVGAARSRLSGETIPVASIAFSEQLFSYCSSENIETLAISSHPRADQIRDGRIWAENRPKPFPNRGGIVFHLSALSYACYLAFRARRFGANLAIIDSGTTHYFLLTVFRLFGIRVAVNLHNILWPAGFPPQRKVQRVLRSLNAWFFQNIAAAAIGVSPECERQVLNESRGRIPFFQYRCQFLASGFRQSQPYKTGTFHIACVGRVEENKGFLDIAKIAESLRIKSMVPIVFEICGDGSAMPKLRQIIQEKALSNLIIHGHLSRAALLNIYANSHAIIVPTKSSIGEGMPLVCAEAMLCSLPVITSQVSNTFDVIGPATMRAETDNIESYVNAILSLTSDYSIYKRLRAQCPALSKQFLDPTKGYSAAINQLIMTLFPNR